MAVCSLLFACGSPTETGGGDDPNRLGERCTNPEHGFSVSYPAGWHTNSGDVIAPCTAFDPDPVEIPPQSEMPFEISIVFDVEEVPLGEVTRPSEFEDILFSERLTGGSRDVMLVETESTGQGLAPPGMRSLRFAIDMGDDRTLVATTHDSNEAEYERDKEILRRMVNSLDLPEPRVEPDEDEDSEETEP